MILPLPIVEVEVAFGAASTRPAIINRDPAPDETGVPRGGPFAFEIIDPEASGINSATVNVEIGGASVLQNGAVQAGWSATITAIDDGLRYSLTPDDDFASEASVLICVDAETNDSITGEFEWTITIEDYVVPTLDAGRAIDLQTVEIDFSEPIAIPSGAVFTITAAEAPAASVTVTGSSASGSTITLSTDRALSPGRSYVVTVTGVEDVAGNAVAAGSTVTIAGFVCSPSERSFDLWRWLPLYNRRADDSGDLRALIDVFQEVFDLALCQIDRFRWIYDIERASEAYIDQILYGLGSPFVTEGLSLTRKRRLAGALVGMYRLKGTSQGIVDAIRFFLGLEVPVRGLGRTGTRLGYNDIGIDFVLGSSDRRDLYTFVIEAPRAVTDDERAQITAIALYMKPAREYFGGVREPAPAPLGDWIIGTSALGLGTTIGG